MLNTITINNNKYCLKDFYARKSSDEQIKEYKNFHSVAYNSLFEDKGVKLNMDDTSHKWKKGRKAFKQTLQC